MAVMNWERGRWRLPAPSARPDNGLLASTLLFQTATPASAHACAVFRPFDPAGGARLQRHLLKRSRSLTPAAAFRVAAEKESDFTVSRLENSSAVNPKERTGVLPVSNEYSITVNLTVIKEDDNMTK